LAKALRGWPEKARLRASVFEAVARPIKDELPTPPTRYDQDEAQEEEE
jgi:hypothetical protein